MSVSSFCVSMMRERIAPPSVGSVKARINIAARRLRWSATRATSIWYGDPRATISGEELADIESLTGVKYARKELEENDELERRIASLIGGENPPLYRLLVAAIREALGDMDRTGNQNGERK